MFPVLLSSLLFGFLLLTQPNGAAADQKSAPADNKTSIEDVIPLTMSNIRGHAMLYNEGWYVVTSSSKAFDYAKERSIISSKTAIAGALRDVGRDSGEYANAVKTNVRDSAETAAGILSTGTKQTGSIFAATHELGKAELDYSQESFKKAMDSFVRGNLTIAKRTEADRQELANMPGNYFNNLKSDFSNVFELAGEARKKYSGRIEPAWETAFQKAGHEFQREYEKSGSEQNSLMALGPILFGYLKSFYHGIAAPTSKTIVKTTVAGTTYAVFLPITATSIVAGRTVQSVGLTVYYAGKTGVKLISPTIEAGLLSGMSLLSVSAVPITYAAGGSIGAINQVAFTTAGPAAGIVQGAASTTVHSAAYVGFLAYDAVKGTTQVVINQAASGIVLGYNALTAIPSQAFLGVVDVVCLAYDGPRLVIAAVRGRIKTSKDSTESYSLGDLPVGTVVDLKKLENTEGVTVEVISTDPKVIKEVLEKIPDDVREKNAK